MILVDDSVVICPVCEGMNCPRCTAYYLEKRICTCGFDPWENEKLILPENLWWCSTCTTVHDKQVKRCTICGRSDPQLRVNS